MVGLDPAKLRALPVVKFLTTHGSKPIDDIPVDDLLLVLSSLGITFGNDVAKVKEAIVQAKSGTPLDQMKAIATLTTAKVNPSTGVAPLDIIQCPHCGNLVVS